MTLEQRGLDLTIQLYKFLKEIYPDINLNLIGIDIDPTLIQRAVDSNEFPNNISYINLDFMNKKSSESSLNHEKFDFVFCFSITMWIHLNNGDSGLVNFIKDICQIAELILIEPQPWKCYKTAVRRMKRSCNEEFPLFSQLKIRNNVDDYILDLIKQEGFHQIFETLNSEWGRKIILFHKKR
ncbi:probable RNA methyltransferase CG11342 isoform X2 [Chrysoperla carnea]|uniref:probable RNA methyltransferase CG11342 isoform X2 n=1 Tax=Chrysoperla carnea TaxID=189513 RepID=UPI001D083303|nr:probable RNA methyltransferase CG11342 isoform X2 [Chrysoperla carnea]